MAVSDQLAVCADLKGLQKVVKADWQTQLFLQLFWQTNEECNYKVRRQTLDQGSTQTTPNLKQDQDQRSKYQTQWKSLGVSDGITP